MISQSAQDASKIALTVTTCFALRGKHRFLELNRRFLYSESIIGMYGMSTVNSEKQVTIEKNTTGDMAAAVIVA